jgi:uncharacterized protein (TIGR00251 family)
MGRRISVTVKPNARSPSLTQLTANEFRAAVCKPARDGAANRALIELIACHFGVAQSTVKIARGHHSRHKIIDIS